jgi:hypothetical protein
MPHCLRALGDQDLPAEIDLDGCRYVRVRTFKHDFFAASGRYRDGERQIVLKVGRRAGFLGMPLGWIGRLLARHEADLFSRLADSEGIPRLSGMWGEDAIVHEFSEGHTLRRGDRMPDDFFERLEAMIGGLHRRQMAYVDLEKPQNVLIGEDGRPYLVDFQISWPWPVGWLARSAPGRWLGRRLQQGDLYHLRKLRRRFRPDQMTAAELAESYRRPWPVRLHRRLTQPATSFRRWVLLKLGSTRQDGERGRCNDQNVSGVVD